MPPRVHIYNVENTLFSETEASVEEALIYIGLAEKNSGHCMYGVMPQEKTFFYVVCSLHNVALRRIAKKMK